MELDEWQQFVLRGSLLERPDGRWSAKEVGLEVARQNGKGELLEARGLIGLFLLDERLLIHSAHEFATAVEALDRMDDRIARNPRLKALCKPTKRSHGEEGIYRKDGRKLRYRTRTKGGGRGFSADWLALDEAMFIAQAFHGALMPTVSAMWNPQIWYTGSAVDQRTMEHGLVFARLRERAIQGDDDRLAYFGWSPDFTDPDAVSETAAQDPAIWADGNPTLGMRIEHEHVALEQRSMDHRTFCVERLGVGDWPSTAPQDANTVIDLNLWAARRDANSHIQGEVTFAFDVQPDRSTSAIGVAGRRPDGQWHVELIEHRPGTGWLPQRLAELKRHHHSSDEAFCDKAGPAASLIPELTDLGVAVNAIAANEYAQACSMFVDAVDNGTLNHLGHPELDSSLRGAQKRKLGETFAWGRINSGIDITPLVSVTQALYGATVADHGSRMAVFH